MRRRRGGGEEEDKESFSGGWRESKKKKHQTGAIQSEAPAVAPGYGWRKSKWELQLAGFHSDEDTGQVKGYRWRGDYEGKKGAHRGGEEADSTERRRRRGGEGREATRSKRGEHWRDVKLRHGPPRLATGDCHLQGHLGITQMKRKGVGSFFFLNTFFFNMHQTPQNNSKQTTICSFLSKHGNPCPTSQTFIRFKKNGQIFIF